MHTCIHLFISMLRHPIEWLENIVFFLFINTKVKQGVCKKPHCMEHISPSIKETVTNTKKVLYNAF